MTRRKGELVMRYLINRCIELMDQYECSVDRQIICITNDVSFWEQFVEIEIFEIHPDGELELIKHYNSGSYVLDLEEGVGCLLRNDTKLPLPQDIIDILEYAKKWEY